MNAILEADAVILLPKMKTHMLTGITGAVKLTFGNVPGLRKGGLHCRYPDVANFAQMLMDLSTVSPAVLTIMDGIQAMESELGPDIYFEFLFGAIPRDTSRKWSYFEPLPGDD